jgi:branched-chain amino acid aminotransferase
VNANALGAPLGFEDRDGLIWLDGRLTPWRDARLHVMSHGLHYASCVFEGARAYGGALFKSTEHSERLHRSARMLGFEIPFPVSGLDAAAEAVLGAIGAGDAYVRTVAWRGAEEMGVAGRSSRIHVAACAWPTAARPAATAMRLAIAKWARPSPATAPTAAKASGLYMISTLAKQAAEDEGCDDALMYDWRGLVAEATSSNIFLLIDGRLHTPTPEGFLDGITRQTVIGLARDFGLEVVERAVQARELALATEVLLTGTAIEVAGVASIGPWRFERGRVTAALSEAYARLVRRAQPALESAVGSEG